MRRAVMGTSLAVAGGLVAAGVGLWTGADRATATSAQVRFTADALPTWQTNGIVWALAHSGSTVFAGGTFSQIRPPQGGSGAVQNAVNFAAFDAATGNPTNCKLSFTIGSGTATVRALAVSPDGKTLYAGGYFSAVNGTPASSLAAVDIASCTPKASFHPQVNATVRALAVTADTVYAGGDFTQADSQSRGRFAAVNASTGAVLPFDVNADAPGRAITVAPDGKHVVLGGDFFTVNGTSTHALAVVDAGSGAVTTPYPGFIADNSVVKSLAADGDGVYTGNEGTGHHAFDGRIGLDPATFAQRWRDTCYGATQSVLPYRSVLYSASHAHDCSEVGEFPDGARHHFLAQSTGGTSHYGWFPQTNDGLGEQIGPRALTVATSGSTDYLWSGGEFTTVNDAPAQGLTRFASTGDKGAPSTPVATVESVKPAEIAVHVRSAFDADDSRLTYRIYRDGGTTPVATLTGDSTFWSRPQLTWTDKGVTAGASHSYRVTATDAAGNTSALSASVSASGAAKADAYASAVLGDGAQLYWRYTDAYPGLAADTSPADSNGVHVGGPALRQSPGAVPGSTALGLNGTSQWVYSDHRFAQPTAYSMETWFKTSTTTGGLLTGFGDNTAKASTAYDKQVWMNNAGRVVFGVNSGGWKTLTSSGALNNNAWHHMVATQSPNGMALYIDGKLQASNTVAGSRAYSGYWHAGYDNLRGVPGAPTSYWLTGQLDETAVYPTALTAAKAASHYNLR
ncbi:LamG-like jellyroll fold domain-containing protein [Streptomyces sp. NPDC005227]|uniref:LamG-like jellyroll fold domain-containing protein n=1 Tax=Streptomyces sp. NPDC005227 TaxID=3364707 RepID=UPI0036CE4D5D